MLVSVIIPVYNGEKYLSRSLDALLNQSYPHWQGIIIDDGSTDGSGLLAEKYCQKDGRFTVIHKENEGQSAARIHGILASKGDVLMFLDSDDAWTPDCLEKVTDIFRTFASDVVMFPSKVVREDGSIKGIIGGFGKEGYVEKRKIYESLLSSHDLNSLCLKAFQRSLAEPEELKRSAHREVRIGEDKIMLLPMITKAEKVYYLDMPLYLYTHHHGSISHGCKASQISTMISKALYEETKAYLSVWKMDDEKHREKLEIYYLRHLMDCFYKMRKHCREKAERKEFKSYPWRGELPRNLGKLLGSKELRLKEKIKLIFMKMSV